MGAVGLSVLILSGGPFLRNETFRTRPSFDASKRKKISAVSCASLLTPALHTSAPAQVLRGTTKSIFRSCNGGSHGRSGGGGKEKPERAVLHSMTHETHGIQSFNRSMMSCPLCPLPLSPLAAVVEGHGGHAVELAVNDAVRLGEEVVVAVFCLQLGVHLRAFDGGNGRWTEGNTQENEADGRRRLVSLWSPT